MKAFRLHSGRREEFLDITRQVSAVVAESGMEEGACLVYVPHTTAGVTINENADPDVRTDLLGALSRLVPREQGFLHSEENSDAHLKASMMGFQALVPVSGGALALGRWQALYFCEFDGPRDREVFVQLLSGLGRE